MHVRVHVCKHEKMLFIQPAFNALHLIRHGYLRQQGAQSAIHDDMPIANLQCATSMGMQGR